MRDGTTLNDFMHWDNTLFDGIILHSDLSHGTLVSAIMLKCGLRNPLYEDYDVFKSQVHMWFAAHEWNFNRLVNLINLEYNPLWNKDGEEIREIDTTTAENETTDRDTLTQRGGTNTSTETETASGTDNRVIAETYDEDGTKNTNTTTHDEQINSVKGFNATDWQETDKAVNDGTRNENETNTTDYTKNTTDGFTHGKTTNKNGSETFGENQNVADDTERNLNATGKTIDRFRAFGNIGVTTSQQMFREEWDLLGKCNIYDYIAELFDNDLMSLFSTSYVVQPSIKICIRLLILMYR